MANVFARKKIVLVKGKGALVWDMQGKEYLDFTSSYGVAALGHSHPKVVKAINEQTKKLISCHSGFYNPKRAELLQKIVNLTPNELNKVFLSNSGAESVECAIKLARKFSGKPEIISFMGAYHGKTMGALSATWDKKYRRPFEPLIPEFKHITPNNLDKLHQAVTDKTAAVLLEPIRGEGGVRVPQPGFLQGVKKICENNNVLLILDEVQTSFGRTGKIFSAEHWNITPDILCLGKAITGGYMSFAATLTTSDVAHTISKGEPGVFMHGPTFMGNPLACAVANASIDLLLSQDWKSNIRRIEERLKVGLEPAKQFNKVADVRVLGAIGVIELKKQVDMAKIQAAFIEKGIWIRPFGKLVYTMPPYIIDNDALDKITSGMVEVVKNN